MDIIRTIIKLKDYKYISILFKDDSFRHKSFLDIISDLNDDNDLSCSLRINGRLVSKTTYNVWNEIYDKIFYHYLENGDLLLALNLLNEQLLFKG